jgi:hypothetical protein
MFGPNASFGVQTTSMKKLSVSELFGFQNFGYEIVYLYYKYEDWNRNVCLLKMENVNFSKRAPQHAVLRHESEGLYVRQMPLMLL